ncbi:hypothetical protein K469DRAFT_708576 [Zopfia rhizophila CBS 207.26]|uniref:DUF6594 domain-containing protein n=1 Tax=Zopfia rhizophila CBS 207.26 TaxID=1314779 RepID=A0A6A6E2U5_9PEZI|nr:hypothetical protein K469DRAFT_708576 [Zopfia rhizophila CBS 207.26]
MARGGEKKRSCQKIEEYRSGYPQFTALLSAHEAFQNVRRFTRTRMRLLLLKQDEITMLEEKLDTIDSKEDCALFLGCSRRDNNTERQQVVQQLSTALTEYDVMLVQNHRVLSLPSAKQRDLNNLKKWIKGTASISRQESAYLESEEDLINLTGSRDIALTFVEDLIGDCIFVIERGIRRISPSGYIKRRHKLTADEHIFLLGPRLSTFCRILTTWVATVVLLVPIFVLSHISNSAWRLVTIALSAGLLLTIVSIFTKARTMEIFTAGASYAAVLVVFTSANDNFNLISSGA